jgi:hypothetical protein
MMTTETLKATNEQMEELISWRSSVALALPTMISRAFSLRGQEFRGPVGGKSLETRLGWHLSQVHRRDPVSADDLELEMRSYDNLSIALLKAEWSAENGGKHPDAPGAPWAPKGTPFERLKAEMQAFEQWVVDHAEINEPVIEAVKAKIEDHDFSDFFLDGLADFKTHITMRALGTEYLTNNSLVIKAIHETEEWFHQLRDTVANRNITALIYDRRAGPLLEIMDKLSHPVAQPGV